MFIYNNTVLKLIQFCSQIYNYCNKDQETYALTQEECISDSMDQTLSYKDMIETQLNEYELQLFKDIYEDDNMERNVNQSISNLQTLYNSLHNRHAGNVWMQLLMKIIEQHQTQESFLSGLYISFHNQYYGNYKPLMLGRTHQNTISYEYYDPDSANLTQAKVEEDNTDLMLGETPQNTISYEYEDTSLNNLFYKNMIKQKIQEGHNTYVNLTQAKVEERSPNSKSCIRHYG